MTHEQKAIKKLKAVSKILFCLPFIRCIILNGSLASGTFKESSDIDLLIISKSGRIFTARFFAVLLIKILRLKRPKDNNKSHAGKYCLNYFLTESFLQIPTERGGKMDKYCAENYSQSILIAGDERIFDKFLITNRELFERYNLNSNALLSSRAKCNPFGKLRAGLVERSCKKIAKKDSSTEVGMTEKKSGMTERILRAFGELLLTNKLGNYLEQRLKNIQIRSIKKDPRTKKYPELIVYNDRELRFHPPKK